MSDKSMRDSHDPILTRLFAEQDRQLPSDNFITQLIVRLELEQRKQRAYLVLAVSALLAVVALMATWIAQTMTTLAKVAAAGLVTVAPFFQSPLSWLVCGALVFAFLPVIFVWRAFRR